ncbi:ubiquitin carboxyl-terminal hydrolase 21 isoform X2 [Pseudophryne corroboree]|uniref:ubiquitin carboxyl-terminal hydrolase 21 isoform X2 n=1 Tax=Pseudophryne corroboree TaxID=495146 RepID=UPI0030821A9F
MRVHQSLRPSMPQACEPRFARSRESPVITTQPAAVGKVLTSLRTVSQERSAYASTIYSNGTVPAPKLRPLPPRPLVEKSKDRGRSAQRTDPASKRGPVKANHMIIVTSPPPPSKASAHTPQVRVGSLSRSKSVSHGDLSLNREKTEEISKGLAQVVVRERSASSSRKPPLDTASLRRSSSLKRLNVLPAVEAPQKTCNTSLLSLRPDVSTKTTQREPQESYQHPQACGPPDSPSPSSLPPRVPVLGSGHVGLRNLGNTCFLNAVLQCLSSTKPLRDYILRQEFRHEQAANSRTPQDLTEAFADVLTSLWSPEPPDSANPARLRAVFQKYIPSFTGYSQQDAQEFLKFFMDRIHIEINRKCRKTPSILSDAKRLIQLEPQDSLSDDERANQMWKQYLEREDSKVVDLFVGQLKSCLKCQACGYRSPTFDVFCDLSLPIPKKGFTSGKVSLIDSFSLFTKEEELNSENAPEARCTTCMPSAITQAVYTTATTPATARASPDGASTMTPESHPSVRAKSRPARRTSYSTSWKTAV